MKRLVIYYSNSGNTKRVAEYIAYKINADIAEIKPLKDFPQERSQLMRKGCFQVFFNVKPSVVGVPDNIYEYDEIILGSPIWAGSIASIVNSFLYRYDVKDKIVGLFVTSGSGHGERCIKKISKKLKNLRYSVSLIGGAKHSKELEDFVNKLI